MLYARYNSDAFERVVYTESHDEVANGRSRVPEEIWPGNASSWFSKKRSTLGAAIVMTAPGIPMLFQGQELLEDGYFTDTDPIDWSKAVTFAGIRDLYRDLISMRRNLGGSTQGLRGQHINVHHVNDGAKTIAYHRWDGGGPGDDVVVFANFGVASYPSYASASRAPAGGTSASTATRPPTTRPSATTRRPASWPNPSRGTACSTASTWPSARTRPSSSPSDPLRGTRHGASGPQGHAGARIPERPSHHGSLPPASSRPSPRPACPPSPPRR